MPDRDNLGFSSGQAPRVLYVPATGADAQAGTVAVRPQLGQLHLLLAAVTYSNGDCASASVDWEVEGHGVQA